MTTTFRLFGYSFRAQGPVDEVLFGATRQDGSTVPYYRTPLNGRAHAFVRLELGDTLEIVATLRGELVGSATVRCKSMKDRGLFVLCPPDVG
jgi:hypothetical protein